jgi:superfamily I DNA and/or RNA helicase
VVCTTLAGAAEEEFDFTKIRGAFDYLIIDEAACSIEL